ncbi:MAG: hypothetical protein KC978_24115, partial [Candidatus Omnitrophica bacterium]|nr:hypothetical protein [Candidatus Omnitrophota bacterium]
MDSEILINSATSDGGGVGVYGSSANIAFTGTRIAGNVAGNLGGGLFVNRSSQIEVTGLALSGNSATSGGGGCYNSGDLTFYGSTISSNTTELNGAGVLSETGTLRIINTTLSGNLAKGGNGGGVSARLNTNVDLIHTTITNNHAGGSGGGLHAFDATVHMGNSILAENTATVGGPDLFGIITSLDYNLIGSLSNGSLTERRDHTFIGGDPLLGPLADNGGPTLTHSLLAGSPAIDAGGIGISLLEGLMEDQRGFMRFADILSVANAEGGVDIGAVEILALEVEDASASENSGHIEFTVTLSNPPPHDQNVSVMVRTASVVGGAAATD